MFFFFNATATTEIYTLSLHDALPILSGHSRLNPAMSTDSGKQKKPGLRVLFPTLIYEDWYADYDGEREKLIAFVHTLSQEDTEGKEYSAREYPNGSTSYFSRSDLYKPPELTCVVAFLYPSAKNFAYQHHRARKSLV
mgnify:CR=1 FL=1